jgi:hypothetical protein
VCSLPGAAGVGAIDRVVEAVESTLAGQQLVLLGRRKLPDLDLPKVRAERVVELMQSLRKLNVS